MQPINKRKDMGRLRPDDGLDDTQAAWCSDTLTQQRGYRKSHEDRLHGTRDVNG